jgi:hypothetical protein
MHLRNSSLFCVITNLDVMCSPNRRFITEIMVSSFSFDCTVFWDIQLHLFFSVSSMCIPYWNIFVLCWNNTTECTRLLPKDGCLHCHRALSAVTTDRQWYNICNPLYNWFKIYIVMSCCWSSAYPYVTDYLL